MMVISLAIFADQSNFAQIFLFLSCEFLLSDLRRFKYCSLFFLALVLRTHFHFQSTVS